jgi:hypothetical protein
MRAHCKRVRECLAIRSIATDGRKPNHAAPPQNNLQVSQTRASHRAEDVAHELVARLSHRIGRSACSSNLAVAVPRHREASKAPTEIAMARGHATSAEAYALSFWALSSSLPCGSPLRCAVELARRSGDLRSPPEWAGSLVINRHIYVPSFAHHAQVILQLLVQGVVNRLRSAHKNRGMSPAPHE